MRIDVVVVPQTAEGAVEQGGEDRIPGGVAHGSSALAALQSVAAEH